MDLMDDENLKKSVIDQMMGELDDVTADSLRKPSQSASSQSASGPVKGVEIAITVSPKSGDEMPEGDEDNCMEPGCEEPMHDHSERDKAMPEEDGDYISQLLKKLG